MLVVDVNKRYTINQIKGDRWIIQGEPYDFLREEDEFCCAQNHAAAAESDETNVVLDDEVVEETSKLLGEETPVKVVEVCVYIVFYLLLLTGLVKIASNSGIWEILLVESVDYGIYSGRSCP